jgi:hypothetical protein
METLWKRLSKENKTKLTNSATLYPCISGNLINALKIEVSWASLKFEHIIWLMQNTTGEKTLIENVDKLFDNE